MIRKVITIIVEILLIIKLLIATIIVSNNNNNNSNNNNNNNKKNERMKKEKMKDPMNFEGVNLRNVDRKKVKQKTQAVNQMLSRIHTESIVRANSLILVGANVVAESLGKKEVNMRITTRYHGGNGAYRPVLQN